MFYSSGEDDMDDLEENKDNMNLDESAFFSMGSLLGQGTDNQPKAISGLIILEHRHYRSSSSH